MEGNRGQIGVQSILIVFISVIVGILLFQVIAQEVGTSTSTISVANQSETLATNGNSIYIEEYRALSSVVILNQTDNSTVPSSNYTVTNNAINPTTNALSVKVTTDDAAVASLDVYVSGTAQPLDYIADSGARAVANLIVIFFALAIAVVALVPTFREKFMDMLK